MLIRNHTVKHDDVHASLYYWMAGDVIQWTNTGKRPPVGRFENSFLLDFCGSRA